MFWLGSSYTLNAFKFQFISITMRDNSYVINKTVSAFNYLGATCNNPTAHKLAALNHQSITGAVFPAVPPSLVHARAVKLGFAEPGVDVVVEATEPLGEGAATAGVGPVGRCRQAVPEVLRARSAGEELGEEVDEMSHVLLLGPGGLLGVMRGHGVKEGPGVTPQLVPVRRTLLLLLPTQLPLRPGLLRTPGLLALWRAFHP